MRSRAIRQCPEPRLARERCASHGFDPPQLPGYHCSAAWRPSRTTASARRCARRNLARSRARRHGTALEYRSSRAAHALRVA